MTFLKKLGQVLLKVVAIAAGIGPIITPFLGSGTAAKVATTTVNDLTAVGQVVVQIETAFAALPPGTTGAQKLAAAVPLVANIIKTSEMVVGKKIANEALFTQACTEYTQATVDLLNSIHPDAVVLAPTGA
jgi:hypothetical protein